MTEPNKAGITEPRKIYTVSELTSRIKALLEKNYSFIWISGEISNLRIPASGHCYFTLKDPDSQIQAVMFKGQVRNLKFAFEAGMQVTGFGRISVYAPRGSYQIILEYLEPSGAGALQAAFEQLKRKLSDEGLFDARYKQPIPFMPSAVAVISSATGSVVHDIIRIIFRRFSNMQVLVIPAAVQGDAAEAEIVSAMELLNSHQAADVAILARGGGSLEDLSAFNSEAVARAVFKSRIPVISAVGHETDYTIADFTADLRAPTPSAAAELAVPVKEEVRYTLEMLTRRISGRILNQTRELRQNTEKLAKRLVHPRRRMDDLRIRLDDVYARLIQAAGRVVKDRHDRLSWRYDRLLATPLQAKISAMADRRSHIDRRLKSAGAAVVQENRLRLEALCGRINALSPLAVMQRGYSITRTLPEHRVLTDASVVDPGKKVEVILAKGVITCRIERINQNGKKDI